MAFTRHFEARLPAELADRIIDHLHSDKLALATCSLVCKTWLPASRYHFFQTNSIRLTPDNIHSFVESLNSSESTFFRHALHIIISTATISRPPSAERNSSGLRASFIFDTLSHHLSRLKIKSLSLACLDWDIESQKLEELFEYFATISILDLQTVDFLVPDEFIKFITSFLSLERLSLYGISFQTTDVDHITPFTLSPLLRFLDLTSNSHILPWFLTAVQLPTLDHFNVANIKYEHLDAISAILQSLGPSLHNLMLGFAYPGTFISGCRCSSSLIMIQVIVLLSIWGNLPTFVTFALMKSGLKTQGQVLSIFYRGLLPSIWKRFTSDLDLSQ